MMGRTHITAGMAAAVIVCRPEAPVSLVIALTGGALGGLLSDFDVKHSRKNREALQAKLTLSVLLLCLLYVDYQLHGGICNYMLQNEHLLRLILGASAFAVLVIYGATKPHRSFLHSLTALVGLCAAQWLMYPPLMLPLGAGFVSHLLLDVTNRQPLRLLYPVKKGLCLKLFPSNGKMNRCCFVVSLVCVVAVCLSVCVPAAHTLFVDSYEAIRVLFGI